MSTEVISLPLPLLPIPGTLPLSIEDSVDLRKWISIEMALAHNLMIRAVNSLWINAPLVTPADEVSYAGYGLACIETILTHHHVEEEIIFPRLQKKISMGHNVEQHEVFRAPMDAIREYFERVYQKEEEYDAEKIRRLLKVFAEPLYIHLAEEIATIGPEQLSIFTQEELRETYKALEDHLKGLGGFFHFFPFAMTAHDNAHAPFWPLVPAPIKWFSINIGYWVNRSYWKFAPFDRAGKPQTYKP